MQGNDVTGSVNRLDYAHPDSLYLTDKPQAPVRIEVVRSPAIQKFSHVFSGDPVLPHVVLCMSTELKTHPSVREREPELSPPFGKTGASFGA